MNTVEGWPLAKDFNSTRAFANHVNTHSEEIFKCPKCPNIWESIIIYKHVESSHECVWYPCNQCDYEATIDDALKQHIESIHEDVRYSCSQCNYKVNMT